MLFLLRFPFLLFRLRLLLFVATGIAALLFATQALAWPAQLDHATDGDTVTVVNTQTGQRVRVRLQGIDAPETTHGKHRPGQKYGPVAKRFLQKLLKGAQVSVIPNGTHSYDRIVGRVLANGQDVALPLVKAGLAWDYPRYDRQHHYTAAQRAAQQAHRGLWTQSNPTPPWDWRHHVWTH